LSPLPNSTKKLGAACDDLWNGIAVPNEIIRTSPGSRFSVVGKYASRFSVAFIGENTARMPRIVTPITLFFNHGSSLKGIKKKFNFNEESTSDYI